MDVAAARAEVTQALAMVKALRNHCRTVTAYLADAEERLDALLDGNPQPEGGTGNHERNGHRAAVG